ncbi:MAG: rhomboid family intramembrane serine protease [Geobacter sp.]|nr:rhomboid family intramembrane serine protease [Geobacter sp.]
MTQRAILCPRCRRLVGSEEAVCSWCGTSRSAAWWHLINWTQGGGAGDGLVKVIITLNVLYFALSLMLGNGGGFMSPGQTSLMMLGATGTLPINYYGRFWSLLSANYLHGGILHIIFNMMALRQLAPLVISEYGPSRLLIIYTLGGIFGFGVSYFAGVAFTIGASAAVCGLIGAMLYYGKTRGGAYGNSVYREVGGWIFSLFLFGMIFPGINNWGHAGGVVGGVLIGMLVGYGDRRPETSIHKVMALLCAVATVGVLGWAIFGAVVR